MKRTILTITAILLVSIAFAQSPAKVDSVKNDSLVVLSVSEANEFIAFIERYVDSKSASQSIRGFLEQRLRVIPRPVQPVDKPKKQ